MQPTHSKAELGFVICNMLCYFQGQITFKLTGSVHLSYPIKYELRKIVYQTADWICVRANLQ